MSHFVKSTSGNTSLFIAVVLVPVMGLILGGVDVMRFNSVKSEIQSALDSAALATASLSQQGDVEDVARNYVLSNLSARTRNFEGLDIQARETRQLGFRSVTVTATLNLPTVFLGILDRDSFQIDLSSTARQDQTNLELAVVLDISSSMRGSKVSNLKSAAEDFIDTMFEEDERDTTSMSLVPFGGHVNVGLDLFNRFVVPADMAEVDPDKDDYNEGYDVPEMQFRFSNGDACLEISNDYFDTGLLDDETHGQLPSFWRWWDFHPWCPDGTSAAIFNSGDPDTLIDRVNEMTLSDGTGMNYGALWGLKALSPAWAGQLGGDFSDRPAAFSDGETLKALVIMTDGEITEQNRPKDFTIGNVHTNRANTNARAQGSKSNQGNRSNMQKVLLRGNDSNPITHNRAVTQFQRVCQAARDNGIIVFTIGFQIREGDLSDRLLEACATDPTKYYFVEGLDIGEAFEGISATLQNLRVTSHSNVQ